MYRFDYDLAAIAIYLIIIINFLSVKHIKSGINKVFGFTVVFCLITPVSDIFRMIAVEKQMSYGVVMTLTSTYFISQQVVSLLLFGYVYGQVKMHQAVKPWLSTVISAPAYIGIAFIVTNPVHKLIFSYEDGMYEWNPTGSVLYISLVIYFIAAVGYCHIHKKTISRTFINLVYLIAILNALGRTFQDKNQTVLIHSFVVSICVLIIFLYTQKDQNYLDPWTGLMNKAHLPERLKKMVHNEIPFSLVIVRIGDYDLLTSTYGVLNVETLIAEIAKYLQTFVPVGDAFVVSNSCYAFVTTEVDPIKTDEMKQQIYEGISKQWMINGMEISCSSFVTSVEYPLHCKDEKDMRAVLLYFQKMHRLRFGVVPVDELGLKDKAREQLVKSALEDAMTNRSFEIHYQPICTTEDKKFVTAEALVRLTDPVLGPISPGEFIPLAESNGSIVTIGNIILEKVCEFLSENDISQYGVEYVEINLSTVQCLQRNFKERVTEITEKYNVPSSMICFEITETASNCAPQIFTDNLEWLNEQGYRLALDDFGTGYGNLQRMVTSDFDIIKFDRGMITMTCENTKLHNAFEKMIIMFHSLNFKVVAEGVENFDQYEFLRQSGCDYIQGFYFSRPLPEKDYIAFMQKHQ